MEWLAVPFTVMTVVANVQLMRTVEVSRPWAGIWGSSICRSRVLGHASVHPFDRFLYHDARSTKAMRLVIMAVIRDQNRQHPAPRYTKNKRLN